MSDSEALVTPVTAILSVMFTFTSLPSRDLMLSVAPSTASMVPRMRTVGGCWADAAVTKTTANNAVTDAIFRMAFLQRAPGQGTTPRSQRYSTVPTMIAPHIGGVRP